MSDQNILDQALNLLADFQKDREGRRSDFMRTILPEVLQPEELKQAAAPMKEEASKTLHAPKYDRRMKFNTALERSGHKATSEEPVKAKEDPAWLKEAASLEELQRRQKGLRFAPKRAFDTSAFDGSGVTGREGVITVEDELLKTPPLPTEDPPEYDVGNKLVMQKESMLDLPEDTGRFEIADPTVMDKSIPVLGGLSAGLLPMTGALFNPNLTGKTLGLAGLASAGLGLTTYGLLRHRQNKHRAQAQRFVDALNNVAGPPMEDFMRAEIANANKTAEDLYPEESFTQRHPGVLPIGLGILGAAAGAVPLGLLGGRQAVKSVMQGYGKRVAGLGTDFNAAVSALGKAPRENRGLLRRAAEDAERNWLKLLDNPPDIDSYQSVGRAAGGLLGGLSGGALGAVGGRALNKPQPWE